MFLEIEDRKGLADKVKVYITDSFLMVQS